MIQMLWKSFYDAKAYAYALKNWRWKFALYFMLLPLFFTLVASGPMSAKINAVFFSNPDFIASQIPEGKIKDGRFSIPEPSPHYVKLKDGMPFMVFSNELLDSAQTKSVFLSIEKDRLCVFSGISDETYFFLAPNEAFWKEYLQKEHGIDTSDGIPVNSEIFIKLLPTFKAGVYLALPVFIFAMSAMMTLVMTLSLSLPVFIMSMTRLPKLGYFGALKVSVLATTPAIMFFAVEAAIGLPSSGGVVYMILSFVIAWRIMNRLPMAFFESK